MNIKLINFDENKEKIINEVSKLHAYLIYKYIDNLNVSDEEKERIIDDIINSPL